MHEAAEHNSVECVRILLAMGAPANPNNSVHQTPASIAETKNHLEVLNLLGRETITVTSSVSIALLSEFVDLSLY